MKRHFFAFCLCLFLYFCLPSSSFVGCQTAPQKVKQYFLSFLAYSHEEIRITPFQATRAALHLLLIRPTHSNFRVSASNTTSVFGQTPSLNTSRPCAQDISLLRMLVCLLGLLKLTYVFANIQYSIRFTCMRKYE